MRQPKIILYFSLHILIFLLLRVSQPNHFVSACGVCVALPLLSPHHHHHHRHALPPTGFAWTAVTRFAEQKPIVFGATLVVHRLLQREFEKRRQEALMIIQRKNLHHYSHWSAENNDSVDADETVPDQVKEEPKQPLTAAMVASIGFYKRFISPLLPPACRFLPTCSQYGVQAIEQFGPSKGAVLTAWRLLRCSPLGGRGYDPPRWPPVGFTYASY
mmetsp:Transcript_8037/g.16100  ORF Transcript_8037/g.16100 Transcript_8037/m.16100 type:complete len:216 (-) Transcript_8037:8-655(-)